MVAHAVAMRCAHWKWHCMFGVDGALAAATVRMGWMGMGWRVPCGQGGTGVLWAGAAPRRRCSPRQHAPP
eukprot:11682377-Prorocentrum_lima.AAC.1